MQVQIVILYNISWKALKFPARLQTLSLVFLVSHSITNWTIPNTVENAPKQMRCIK